MQPYLEWLDNAHQMALQRFCRLGFELKSDEWSYQLLETWLAQHSASVIFQLGGKVLNQAHYLSSQKGQQWLGKECTFLVCDVSQQWDANSFSAALGCLTGGGILFLLGTEQFPSQLVRQWFTHFNHNLVSLAQHNLPDFSLVMSQCNALAVHQAKHEFMQQQHAVDAILTHIVNRKKTPVLLTAERGRGKSSALGLVAAQLMQEKSLNIVITAPKISAVNEVFSHAQRQLVNSVRTQYQLNNKNAVLQFIAPDELMRQRPKADLLLVDEASALPLPFLFFFAQHYPHIVFSSTIYGYEGCGKGLTLKFIPWLQAHYPYHQQWHLTQPIRWCEQDPLELWYKKSFLFNESDDITVKTWLSEHCVFSLLTAQDCVAQPERLAAIFTLLANAHYQTSPNDLFLLLSDPAMRLFIVSQQEQILGCILAVAEGELEDELIHQIQLGKRRPKGQLATVTLANQLGIAEAAKLRSLRIMRIAVQPHLQRQGLGSLLLKKFIQHFHGEVDYLSVSFGATAELIPFWQKHDFHAIKMGSQRDQASGCYSLLMLRAGEVKSVHRWLDSLKARFIPQFCYAAKQELQELEPDIIHCLLKGSLRQNISHLNLPFDLLSYYAKGGSNYESVAVWIEFYLLQLPDTMKTKISHLLLSKVVQQQSWQYCAQYYGFTGRKQVEAQIRQYLIQLGL